MDKIIKDPIYGYISIEKDDQIAIIDCPFFQRLRDIVQTSYISLYPASLHNRFTHSLGVFYLGKKAGRYLLNEIEKIQKDFFVENQTQLWLIYDTFVFACLLHDIGHAPFSHTGERFYFEEGSDLPLIWKNLIEAVNSESFTHDATRVTGAEHEIMSALISLNHVFAYASQTLNIDKELFVRCIIGLQYKAKNQLNCIRNCFISLLNSSTIDVDRLDYLIRDSYMSGYNNTSIDYERLLSSISVKEKKGELIFCFKKPALSVLENAIIAHDAEKKWLQSNPTVLLESCLIEGMIKYVINEYKKEGILLFSEQALTVAGSGAKEWHVKLLSDSDILSFAKKKGYDLDFIKSYHERSLRMKPIWKSEAEYKALFESTFSTTSNGNLLLIEKYFSQFNDLIPQNYIPIIDEELLKSFKQELGIIQNIEKDKNLTVSTKERRETIEKAVFLLEKLKNLSDENGCDFKFLIVKANQFSSGFNKEQFKRIEIFFPNLNKYRKVDEVVNVLKNEASRDKFFYIYVTSELKNKDEKLADKMINIIREFSSQYLES